MNEMQLIEQFFTGGAEQPYSRWTFLALCMVCPPAAMAYRRREHPCRRGR